MDERADEALVADALAGKRESFATLVRRYQDYAYGVAIGRLSDFELARDVVQEAFLCAYRDLRKLRAPERFGGWLLGIVRNTANRAVRELERVRSLAEQLSRTADCFAPTLTPDRTAEEAEGRKLVRRALERLNEKNREAVGLYYVNGLSYADIAEFLGVTEATVQGRLQRARTKLRKELTMVEETFKEEELPEDFSVEIKRLLDAAAVRGKEHERAIRRLGEIGAPAVDPLCEALGDPRISVQRAAARALCQIGDPRALRPIIRVLYAGQGWQADVFGKGQALAVPGVREELLKLLREGGPRYKGDALMALSHAREDEEVFNAILQVFQNPEQGYGSDALQALCAMRPESALEFITAAFDHPDPRVGALACWLAISRGILVPIDACLRVFREEVRPLARLSAASLILRHGEKGMETLKRLLRTGSPVEQATAALALARTGSKEALEVLKRELLGDQHDKKWAMVVSRVSGRHYAEELERWVNAEPGLLPRSPGIAWALAKGQAEAATPVIEESLHKGTPTVRRAAVRFLARQKGSQWAPGQGRAESVLGDAPPW